MNSGVDGSRSGVAPTPREAAEIAESEGDAVALHKYSDTLLRLELFDPAWELYVRASGLNSFEARWIARTILRYVPQRQIFPAIWATIS